MVEVAGGGAAIPTAPNGERRVIPDSMVSTALLGLAVLLGSVGGRLVAGPWSQRAPRLAVAAWLSLFSAVVTSAVLAAAIAAASRLPFAESDDIVELMSACALVLRREYEAPGGVVTSVAGVIASLLLVGRLGQQVIRHGRALREARQRHHRALMLLQPTPQGRGAVQVIPDDRAAAFCLPGRRARIVVTTGAVQSLTPAEMALVLAHERAHLRQRHHAVVFLVQLLAKSFPFVALFRQATTAVPRLLEMAADDAAARAGERRTLASALLVLAAGVAPVGSLGAVDGSAAARVLRLSRPEERLAWPGKALLAIAAGLLLATPALVVVLPAAGALLLHICPLFPS